MKGSVGSVETATTSNDKVNAVLPKTLAPVPAVGSDAQLTALYVPKGKALWVTLQLAAPNATADTPIIAAQGGYY